MNTKAVTMVGVVIGLVAVIFGVRAYLHKQAHDAADRRVERVMEMVAGGQMDKAAFAYLGAMDRPLGQAVDIINQWVTDSPVAPAMKWSVDSSTNEPGDKRVVYRVTIDGQSHSLIVPYKGRMVFSGP